MKTYPVRVTFFLSPKSMFDVGIGAEKLELKPEYSHLKGKENEPDRTIDHRKRTDRDGREYGRLGSRIR